MEIDDVVDTLGANLIVTEKVQHDFVKENALSDDPVKLNKLIIGHGPKYAYYAGMYSMARKKTYFSKQAMEDFYNARYVKLKNNAVQSGQKITEAHMEALIQSNEEQKTLKMQYLKDKGNEDVLYEMKKSLEDRKDLLWTLASNVRAEHKALYTETQ